MATVEISLASDVLEQTLLEHGQAHLWDVLQQLPERAQRRLRLQLEQVDWASLQQVFREHGEGAATDAFSSPVTDPLATLVLQPVKNLIPQRTSAQDTGWQAALRRGEAHLAQGRVAVVMVAGGQGTRLGYAAPKGMFPIGPISGASLYQWCCEQVRYRIRKHGCAIPYIIMTSDATHDTTLKFFEEHDYFGLPAEDVWFVCQGTLPVFDHETGEVLFTDRETIAVSPDGHGGLLEAFTEQNIWQRLRERGIATLAYHQVDNPLTKICDPGFIGWHLQRGSQVTTKVARKRSAGERMGLVLEVNQVPQVVEYSDIPEDVAGQLDAKGDLRFWAGNTAMHVFDVEFLESVATSTDPLPLHTAHKATPYWADGRCHTPTQPNSIKFERFIFDVLPRAPQTLFIEIDRDTEFQPVKNRTGADSPALCQAAMLRLHRDWLTAAGVIVPEHVPVEISPLVAQEASDLKSLLPTGTTILEPIVITRNA